MEKKAAPYGSWKSPITAERVASGTLRFSEVKICGEKVYWIERRPSEQGRCTLMCWSAKEGEKELLPKEYCIRSKVHEYGGGALLVDKAGIYFINDTDQQIYRLKDGKTEKIRSERCVCNGYPSEWGALFYVMEEHKETVENSIESITHRKDRERWP
jgi:hypothetical protein